MQEADFHAAIADRSQPAPHLRFGIYRNNVAAALTNALRVRYPMVEALSGRTGFAALTQDYVAGNLPSSAVLIAYGDTFPDFIAASGQMRECPFLADVARLESCWWRVYHSAEAVPAETERFIGIAPGEFAGLRFGFHPSAMILESSWAVGSIWEALRQGKGLDGFKTDLPQTVLVWRPLAEVRLHVIEPVTKIFLAALMGGASLADAVEITMAAVPDFDLHSQLRTLITSQIITGLESGYAS